MLDEIENQLKRSGQVISIHKYRLLKKYKKYVFLFVEGEDDTYFYPQNAKNIFFDKKIIPLDCNGKDGVLEIKKILENDIDGNIVGFFVDKDFDKNDNIPDSVYVTPSYSVENLVYNKHTFDSLLTTRFSLIPTEAAYKKCMDLYQDLGEKFYDSIHLYNSWIFAQRNYSEIQGSLHLTKNLPAEFLIFDDDNIKPNYDIELIEKKHKKAPKIEKAKIDKASLFLKKTSPETSYRGKFNWILFSHILQILINDANCDKKRQYLDKKVKFNFSKKDPRKFFEEVAPFAKPPKCLLSYFQSMNC